MTRDARMQEAMLKAEELRHVRAAIADAKEALRAAEVEAHTNPDVVTTTAYQAKQAQVRNFVAPLEAKVAHLEAHAEYLVNVIEVIRASLADAA